MQINGVTVFSNFNLQADEAQRYIEYVLANTAVENTPLVEITVKLCDDGKVDLGYLFKGEKFERIRRVTGYLVGSLDRWNDAKQAEERERVKHTGERFTFNEKIW